MTTLNASWTAKEGHGAGAPNSDRKTPTIGGGITAPKLDLSI